MKANRWIDLRVAVSLTWLLLATGSCTSGTPPADSDAQEADSREPVQYAGTFHVTALTSAPMVRHPFLLLVEPKNSGGSGMPEYAGRVKISATAILDPSGNPADETFLATYDEWGNRPEKARGDMGGFREGRNILPMTLVSVRQKFPYYDVTITVQDATNPGMSGSLDLRVISEPPERSEYTEIGRDYDPPPLVAGEPGSFNLVARSGRNSLGFEVQDTSRGEMKFFTNGPGTVLPDSIPDYSLKADEYGRYKHDLTFTEYGQHYLSTLWLTVFGMIRSSSAGPFPVGPRPRTLSFVKADLAEMSAVADTWASPWGTFVAFEFGRLYVTKDGAHHWNLLHEFPAGIRAVGARGSYPETTFSVCVITGDEVRCDCPTDCMEWRVVCGTDAHSLCRPGHPNKDLTCGTTPQFPYRRDMRFQPSWGGHAYEAQLFTSGGFAETGYVSAECLTNITHPGLTFPWAIAEDRTMRTVYWADWAAPEIRFTIDHGQTWGRLISNLPADAGITSLAFDERYRLLYVGTDSFGLWVASVDGVEE